LDGNSFGCDKARELTQNENMLKAGIVGLPNVGKSTLFNALMQSHKAAAENYPFCTVDPNRGVVYVPDERLEAIAQVVGVSNKVPAAIEIVDIAGLVKGASRGEGLGNKFLSHIREVDAIVHVVRCFDNPDVVHVPGELDPLRDVEIVTTELVLADLEAVRKRREKIQRDVKRGDKHAIAEDHVLQRLEAHLNTGAPAILLSMSREEWQLAASCYLLTARPTLFVANVDEATLSNPSGNQWVQQLREYVINHHGCGLAIVCAKLEADLVGLSSEEAAAFLAEMGVRESALNQLIKNIYSLLGLRTFFTFNEKEVRAWPVVAGTTARKAAGKIHTDFERGFIMAEKVFWKDLVEAGSVPAARQAGRYSHEGAEYVVQDGDVLLFRFNV